MGQVVHFHAAMVVAGALLAPMVAAATSALAQESATTSPVDRWSPFIVEASARFGIPESWVRAVMRAESGGRAMLDGQPITSRAGAMGLMQLMPETWAEFRVRLGLGNDAYDPHDNILAGTAYLRALYERYGYPGLFAAYNAGPARFDDHLLGGRPLPDETLAYLATLGQPAFEPASTRSAASGNGLFFALHTGPKRLSDTPSMSSSAGLFVSLSGASARVP
jgi:soluble lytic murein transglycosylase-like protein